MAERADDPGTRGWVPGAGHYIQEDAPEIVVPALQTFPGMER
jgi:pimeloyl-ACP methyl ester carboxylesterase